MKKLTEKEKKEVEKMISYYDSLDKDEYELNLLNGLIKLKYIHDKQYCSSNLNNSQQGNPLSDKCLNPEDNFVETPQVADKYSLNLNKTSGSEQ